MVNNKKIRALALFAMLPAFAAHAATIKVTTNVDESGENSAACSLREALEAAKRNSAYGGCAAGTAGRADRIELEAETYVLGSALLLNTDVVIAGKDTRRQDQIDPVTGKKPLRLRPETIIQAAAGSRIIEMNAGASDLTISDVDLRGANVTGDGGVIYATRKVSLDNVVISGASVSGQGGVIFLATTGAGVSISNSTVRNNSAAQGGGVVGMVCEENFAVATHQVDISRSLVEQNSGGTGAGVIEACGDTIVGLGNATLTANSSPAGSAAINYVVPGPHYLGTFLARSVTAVGNTGAGAVFRLGGLSSAAIQASLVAFNVSANCQFPRDIAGTKTGNYNVLDDATCADLLFLGTGQSNNQTLASSQADLLEPLDDQGGLSRVFLPRAAASELIDKGEPQGSCLDVDQRGATRESATPCDVGAVERKIISAVDDTAENKPRTNRIAFVDVLANDIPGEGAVLLPSSLSITSATAVAEPDKDGDGNPIPAPVPVCSWIDNPMPVITEVVEHADGSVSVSGSVLAGIVSDVKVIFPDGKSTSVAPTGAAFGPVRSAVSQPVNRLVQVIAITADGESYPAQAAYKPRNPDSVNLPERAPMVMRVTTVGGKTGVVTCQYAVQDSNEALSNAGSVKVSIRNRAPLGVSDEFTLPRGATHIVIDVTANDTDENDGLLAPGQAESRLAEYPVKIVSRPALGRLVLDPVGGVPCIDNTTTVTELCYKGVMRYEPFNTLAPFDDSFTYRVIDQEGEDSGTVTVLIKSDAPPEGEGGSAAPGLLLLLGLLGLRRLRRL